MNKTLITLAAGFGLLAAPAFGLTVDDAVQQARSHNLGLETEDLKLAQKADEKNFSFNRLYPTVSVSTTLLRLNQINLNVYQELWPYIYNDPHYADFSGLKNYFVTEDNHWIWSLGVQTQWVLNLAVFRGITQTLIDYQTAKITRDAADAKLARDVRKAFYQLLALREATGVFESQLKVAEDRWKLAKFNFDAGLGSEIAALQAQVTYLNRKPILDDQKVNEGTAQSGFRILLNLPDGAPLDLQGSLDVDPAVRKGLSEIDVDTLVKRYVDGRWDVGTAQGTAKSLENLAKLQADSLWPSLVFGWTADPSVQAPFASATWNDPSRSQYNWSQTNGAFSVTLAWKLDGFLPGSTTGIEIAGRERAAKEAELGAEQTKRAGEAEIRTLIGRLKKSAVALDSLSVALDLAQRSSKLTEEGYQAGTESFNDAQDADLQLQTARLQYLNEELALQSALADLDFALAADRKEWLHG